MAWETGQDGFAGPVGLSGGGDVASAAWAGSAQPAGHGTHRHHCPAYGELVADTAGGPLLGTAPVLDKVHGARAGPGGAVKRSAGTVLKRLCSALAVVNDPLQQRGRAIPVLAATRAIGRPTWTCITSR